MQEAEIFDDYGILRHGGGDGGVPPGEEDIYGPGPQVESIHSDDDPADIPVPDADSDSDLEDESFFTKWLDEIRADEYIADTFMATVGREDSRHGDCRGASGASASPAGVDPAYKLGDSRGASGASASSAKWDPTSIHEDYYMDTWEPDSSIYLDLHDWESTGYDPAVHLVLHSCVSCRLSYSDIELRAAELMREPLEIQFPSHDGLRVIP